MVTKPKIRIFLHPKYAYLVCGTSEGMLVTNIFLCLMCLHRGYSVLILGNPVFCPNCLFVARVISGT